ncbi:hypothetical protein CONLIGDRAFT_686885 [Coniochaeta ligniaria NRRL 30616]|uniref:Uncharacterized protein n=1 Tax=Coniochaeta ligniaria NRRL 30616 TaxID=1408157 RepID=A0A1J7I6X1_9PEZI|nr:hypothetical protein CONLIGDRAFT_686885 [Coniochaeta ligniaria NRRL 30616]
MAKKPSDQPASLPSQSGQSESQNLAHPRPEKLGVNLSTVRNLDEAVTSLHSKMDCLTETARIVTAQNDHLAAQNTTKAVSPRHEPSPRRGPLQLMKATVLSRLDIRETHKGRIHKRRTPKRRMPERRMPKGKTGPYIYHNEQGVPVPCSKRVTTLGQIMGSSCQFPDEHQDKGKADGERECQPSTKRLGVLGLHDNVPRGTSALMSAHDDVGEHPATPGQE